MHFFVYRTLNTNKKVKNKIFLHGVGRSWISEVQNRSESSFDDLHCQRSKQHQGGLNRTRQADSPGISEYTNLKKSLLLGREKKTYSARHCKVCAAHCKVCAAHCKVCAAHCEVCAAHCKVCAAHCKVCAAHKKRSETRHICKFCVVPLQKGLVLRNTIQ